MFINGILQVALNTNLEELEKGDIEVKITELKFCKPHGPLYIITEQGIMITISQVEYNKIIHKITSEI